MSKLAKKTSTSKPFLSGPLLWAVGIGLAALGLVFGYFLWDIVTPNLSGLAFAAVALTGLPLAMAVFNSKREWPFFFLFLWITAYYFSRFIFGGGMLFGTDTMGLGYFAHNFYREHILSFGSYPLWENLLHGGMPFHEGMHGDVLYPTRILELILPLPYALGIRYVLHICLAGFFMFGFLRSLKLCRGSAFFGGLAYSFGPFFLSYIYAGHDGKMFVITLLPLAFWALETALKSGRLWRYLLFGLTYSLMVLSAHMQMAYFAAWGIGSYFVFRVIRMIIAKKNLKLPARHVAVFVVAILIGLAITTLQIYPPFKYLGEHSQRTQRTEESGYAWSTSWSLHPEEIGGLFVPEFAGINIGQTNTYWGRNAFKLNSDYFGIIVLILALGAVILLRSPRTWFFMGLGVFSTVFALGATTPLFKLFYAVIPQVKKFRGPSMLIFLAAFSAVVLSAEMICALRDAEKRQLLFKRGLSVYLAVIGVALALKALLFTVAGKAILGLYSSIVYSGIPQTARATMEANAGTIAGAMWLAVIVLGIALGAYYLSMKGRLGAGTALTLICLASLFDVWRIDRPFVEIIEPEQYFQATPATNFLKTEYAKKPFRVLVTPGAFQDSYLATHGLEEVVFGVGHGNQLRTFDEFIDRNNNSRNLLSRAGMMLLNTDYIAIRGREIDGFQLAFKEGNLNIYKNNMSLPRAFSVYNWRSVASPDEARQAVFSDQFNPALSAVVEGTVELQPASAEDSTLFPSVGIISGKKPEEFEVKIDMAREGLLILCDNWYPEWRAFEGDKELPILRANGTFRAVPLTSGNHAVRFEFEGKLVKKSLMISLAAVLAWVLLFALSLFFEKRGVKEVDA